MERRRMSLVLIALGSNLGDSVAIVSAAMDRLQSLSASPVRRSSLWRSFPVDCPPESPLFVNAAAAFEPRPGETPESLLGQLQAIEREFGRRPKTILNEPRLLDLDLVAFGDQSRSTPELTLPHPRAHLRPFVLAPLAEIAPDFVLPGQNFSVRELLLRLPADPMLQRGEGHRI
jgi:2-amino-4-hydroxy-6-hydroxymethyldihydropteridine diphosphokinase